MVGTSAGSMVGSLVAAGVDLRDPGVRPLGPVPVPEGGPDLERVREVFQAWSKIDRVNSGLLQGDRIDRAGRPLRRRGGLGWPRRAGIWASTAGRTGTYG